MDGIQGIGRDVPPIPTGPPMGNPQNKAYIVSIYGVIHREHQLNTMTLIQVFRMYSKLPCPEMDVPDIL